MNKRKKFLVLNLIGGFLLLWGVIAILFALFTKTPLQILYLCYIGLIGIGVGILTRKSFIIISQVYILTIPLFIWTIDFLYWLIFNHPLFGITDYFFVKGNSIIGRIISLQHLFTIPLSIYSVKLIGLKKKDAWKISFIQITIVYFLVKIFARDKENINCIFTPCINTYFQFPYQLTWFIVIFSMTFITSIILNNTIFKNNRD